MTVDCSCGLHSAWLGLAWQAQGSRSSSDEFSNVAEPPLLALILLLQQKGDSDPLRHTAIVCLMMSVLLSPKRYFRLFCA